MPWLFRLLAAALLLATACAEFTISEKKDGIYATQPKLRIKVSEPPTGADAVELTFLSKLPKEDYTVSVQAQAVVLQLADGKQWMELEAGQPPQPLILTSAKFSGIEILEEGVQVATVLLAPTVDSSSRMIYLSTPPMLLVNGTNFNLKHTSLFFDPPLKDGEDFTKNVLSDKQIKLTKLFGRQWRTDGPGPLKIIGIDTGGGTLELDADAGGTIIAEVRADLEGHGVTVEPHLEVKMYQSTPTLEIKGVGFNTTATALRFANGLKGEGVNYTTTAITPTSITLSLEAGSLWRRNATSLPGPLILLAADAGAGYVALGQTAAKAGRKIATVYEDPTVVAGTAQLYRTHTASLLIEGTGFNDESAPVFYFEDEEFKAKRDYYSHVVNSTHVELKLAKEGWMAAGKSGALKVLAVDTGAGKKAFSRPVTVATVIDDEAVHTSGVTVTPSRLHVLYQSEAVQKLNIAGQGFKDKMTLTFDPALKQGTDYTIAAVTPEELSLKLVSGKKWRAAGGPLTLKTLQMEGSKDVVKLGGDAGIQVATILTDPSVKEQSLRIYATHSKHFTIKGQGFQSTLDPDFKPKVVLDSVPPAAYTVHPEWSRNHIKLWLVEGQKWAHVKGAEEGIIKVLKIDTGAGEVVLPNGGVHVATVYADSDETICDDSCTYANDGQCDEATDSTGGVGGKKGGWGYADDDAIFGDGVSSTYAGFDKGLSSLSMLDSDEAGFNMASCDPGTDCTDCGVRKVTNGTCTNTCLKTARDGICDDNREGGTGVCLLGTDCQDCGPVGASNFTKKSGYVPDDKPYASSSDWFDDDSNFLLDDDYTRVGQETNAKPVYKRTFKDHETKSREREGTGTLFMDVLWAIVILVGGTVSLGFCTLAYRRFKSGGSSSSGSGGSSYLPVTAAGLGLGGGEQGDEFEMSRLSGTDITPDVVRTG